MSREGKRRKWPDQEEEGGPGEVLLFHEVTNVRISQIERRILSGEIERVARH